ncbi:MAG: hypothetical protein KAR45_08865 [Desulfobacteraceae bacterium]|nr:hypothetical protein [Desulfobacteraceae bacterium]
MKEKIITKELAKLYEKQGYLEDSLTCYLSLYEQTKEEEFAKAIEKIKNKLNPVKNESLEESPNKSLDKRVETHWKKPSEYKDDSKADSKEKENKSIKALTLFEQWVNMIILEKKIQNFKQIQVKYE